MSDNPRKNSEGYSDPTAYEGMKPIVAEENTVNLELYNLIKVLKYIIKHSGFELQNRIELRHTKSGRVFK
jgi:hypothetical protein